jgi:hypothetical protein
MDPVSLLLEGFEGSDKSRSLGEHFEDIVGKNDIAGEKVLIQVSTCHDLLANYFQLLSHRVLELWGAQAFLASL